jgi:hypothetical protein
MPAAATAATQHRRRAGGVGPEPGRGRGPSLGPDALLITNISSERAVVLLSENAVPFAEVSAHRATLEEAYMALTSDAAEFRAAPGEQAAR